MNPLLSESSQQIIAPYNGGWNMIRQSIFENPLVALLPRNRKTCVCIFYIVLVQCVLIFIGSASILSCFWSPDKISFDYYKLASIMYLYDSQACGRNLRNASSMTNLEFSNDTLGLDVLPIQWEPAYVTVSTRLSAKTRKYIELSVGIHVVWLIMAFSLRIFGNRSNTNIHLLKVVLALFFYMSVFIVIYDLSMAIVYISHIKQSLTKGMIIRYSGWSVELQLENDDDFGGWLPMIASVCWMRGVIILFINIYICKMVYSIRHVIQMREFKKKMIQDSNLPIPDPKNEKTADKKVLYYRAGEHKPYVKRNIVPKIYY